jgi:hypothetical protein
VPVTLTFAAAFKLGGEDVLPQQFRDLVAKCEGNPADFAPPGVAADWLDENGEPDLAAAFRWIHKRGMGPERRGGGSHWTLSHLPGWVRGEGDYTWIDSYLAAVFKMAAEMKAVRESMEK